MSQLGRHFGARRATLRPTDILLLLPTAGQTVALTLKRPRILALCESSLTWDFFSCYLQCIIYYTHMPFQNKTKEYMLACKTMLAYHAYHNSQVGSLTGQLKASLNSRELAVVPCMSLAPVS